MISGDYQHSHNNCCNCVAPIAIASGIALIIIGSLSLYLQEVNTADVLSEVKGLAKLELEGAFSMILIGAISILGSIITLRHQTPYSRLNQRIPSSTSPLVVPSAPSIILSESRPPVSRSNNALEVPQTLSMKNIITFSKGALSYQDLICMSASNSVLYHQIGLYLYQQLEAHNYVPPAEIVWPPHETNEKDLEITRKRYQLFREYLERYTMVFLPDTWNLIKNSHPDKRHSLNVHVHRLSVPQLMKQHKDLRIPIPSREPSLFSLLLNNQALDAHLLFESGKIRPNTIRKHLLKFIDSSSLKQVKLCLFLLRKEPMQDFLEQAFIIALRRKQNPHRLTLQLTQANSYVDAQGVNDQFLELFASKLSKTPKAQTRIALNIFNDPQIVNKIEAMQLFVNLCSPTKSIFGEICSEIFVLKRDDTTDGILPRLLEMQNEITKQLSGKTH